MTALQSNNAINNNAFPFNYKSSSYYIAGTQPGSACTTSGSGTLNTGTLIYVPIIIPTANNFSAIVCASAAPVSGASAVLGIYNGSSATCKPVSGSNAISGSTEVVSIATGGTVNTGTFASPIYLTPGLYFLAYSPSANAAAQVNMFTTGATLSLGLPSLPTAAGYPSYIQGYTQIFTYSTTLPAVGTLSNLLFNNGSMPLIALVSA